MSSQPSHPNSTSPVESANKTALGKARAEVKDAMARVKAEEKARKKVEETLSSCQEDLKVLQAELDHERQLRAHAERELDELHPVEVDDVVQDGVPDAEPISELVAPEEYNIRPEAVLEPQKLAPATRPAFIFINSLQLSPLTGESSSSIANLENPARVSLRVKLNDSMILLSGFMLQGPGSPRLTADEILYEIEIYTRELPNRASVLLTTHRANLIKDTYEYNVPVLLPGLPAGLHRLHVVVRCGNALGQRDGPVILAA